MSKDNLFVVKCKRCRLNFSPCILVRNKKYRIVRDNYNSSKIKLFALSTTLVSNDAK